MVPGNSTTNVKVKEYMNIFDSQDSDVLAEKLYEFHLSRGRTKNNVLALLDDMLDRYLHSKSS